MNKAYDYDVSRFWAGLAILEQLLEPGSALTSEELSTILGTKNVKGVGAALSGTRHSLSRAGVRFDEAVCKRSVRGRTVWTPGPRIRQAIRILERERDSWKRSRRENKVPVVDAQPGDPGPVLVLRALKSRGDVFQLDGGMSELEEILDDEWWETDEFRYKSIGEVFIERIEPGDDGLVQRVPDGYGENGIWIRGQHDYAQSRVAGAIGTGRDPMMFAWIYEATWVERRIALVDAARQMDKVCLQTSRLYSEEWKKLWPDVEAEKRFRYVEWLEAYGVHDRRSAPPLRLRLRCWHEIVIETATRKRVVLREEGLRGDDQRTAIRAINRWRETRAKSPNELVSVREVRIAKSQPRPVPSPE